MDSLQTISKTDSILLANRIKEDFFKPRATFKTSIFLCGASINDTSKIRFKLKEVFSDWWNSFQYDLIFPEDIFDELLYGRKGKDLLSLENILAESIDVILIIPESPGSFAELGAFANDDNLRKKIVCILDVKYKKDKSFINQGPVKLVKKTNKNSVVFVDPLNLGKNIKNIYSAIREVKKANPSDPSSKKISLLQLDNFLLPTIYLLEPVPKETLIFCLEAATEDEINSYQVTTTALNMLTKKKFIELMPEGFKLTQLGRKHYFNLKRLGSRIKIQNEITALDNLRLEILNLQLRKKKLKF
jgi:hypothetical protein